MSVRKLGKQTLDLRQSKVVSNIYLQSQLQRNARTVMVRYEKIYHALESLKTLVNQRLCLWQLYTVDISMTSPQPEAPSQHDNSRLSSKHGLPLEGVFSR